MNRNRNIKIDFRINGKHDHFIEPVHGARVVEMRATKPKKKGLKRKIKEAE